MPQPSEHEIEVFNVALELPAEKRSEYLDQACAGDPALRQRVEELLKASEESCPCLEGPVAGSPGPSGTVRLSSIPAEKPGDRIGRYKLLQQIGEGGCGVVYMAEQEEPVHRRVALKVIKLGMDTKNVIARFEAERQALALMDHPNIAKVLDAGATDTGRPYFVMELVRGIKITDYCDQNDLSTQERLDLFIQVCRAVQHAHQKGVIHRDIKPSNILVTMGDGVPVPKVIDFGIAKATHGKLTNQTVFTAFEQFIGTPAYMSPEQAEMSALDIDTRSDIYSLGVLLYELLTGQTPFDAKKLLQAGLDEIRRTIREQEPARPSTCLSTMLGADLTEIAKHRKAEPPKLIHLVRGDLDWIVMKCLEKDRTRRYETANGLASDIQRHLNCEPVMARPPSRLYEFRKTLRRHWVGFAATTTVIMALAAGIVISSSEAMRAWKAEQEQIRLRETAQKETEFIKGMLKTALPQLGTGTNAQIDLAILDQLQNAPETEAELRAAVADAYTEIGRYDDASVMHDRVILLQQKLEPRDNSTSLQRATDLVIYGAGVLVSAGLTVVIMVSIRRRLRLLTFVFAPLSLWIMATVLEILFFESAAWLLGCSLLGIVLGAAGMIISWRRSRFSEHKRTNFPVKPWLDTLAGLGFLAVLVTLYYAIEDWRGKRAWENCKREYEARGYSLDFHNYLPPPVPDDQNFFKAPQMAEWFVRRNSGQSSNSISSPIAGRLPQMSSRTNLPGSLALVSTGINAEHMTEPVEIAEVIVLPLSAVVHSEDADAAMQYSSFGRAVFEDSDTVEKNNANAAPVQLDAVPLTKAIESLAYAAGIQYSLDPKIKYNERGEDGKVKPEPVVSVSWESITARHALLAVLNEYGLQLVANANSGNAIISLKSSGDTSITFNGRSFPGWPGMSSNIGRLLEKAVGTNVISPLNFPLLLQPPSKIKPVRVVLRTGKMPDKKEIAEIFRCFLINAFHDMDITVNAKTSGTNSFQIIFQAESAADYLAWSDEYAAAFDLIRDAVKRPYERMDGDYSIFWSSPMPNFVAVRTVSQTLATRAQCHLLLNHPEKALDDLSLFRDVCHHVVEFPPSGKPMTLVSAMINVACSGLYVNIIAEGIRLRAWQEPQLIALQEQLQEIHLPSFVYSAVQAEATGSSQLLEAMSRNFKQTAEKVGIPSSWTWEDLKSPRFWVIEVAPHGWVYQNMAVNSALQLKTGIAGFDSVTGLFTPHEFDKCETTFYAVIENGRNSPYLALLPISIPNYKKAFPMTAHNQTLVNEAQIACVLERYRVAHGQYPETLDALKPQFIEKIPHSLIGGQPLKYRRTSDGKFRLYSIGWDETDHGGKDGGNDLSKGDWVWEN